MKTTLDIDGPLLRDLKRLQKREGKSLSRLVSDLLPAAIASAESEKAQHKPDRWLSKAMGARVDLLDRDAVISAMGRRAGRLA